LKSPWVPGFRFFIKLTGTRADAAMGQLGPTGTREKLDRRPILEGFTQHKALHINNYELIEEAKHFEDLSVDGD